MYFKNAIVALMMLFTSPVLSQIVVDDVGDGWKIKIDSALTLIEKTDPGVYKEVISNCNHITYWLGAFSTTQDSSTILISTKDLKLNSINNLACIIVHESHHLYYKRNRIKMTANKEEYNCYLYEYEFLKKIPNAEDWLTIHVIKCIIKFRDL